MDALETALWQDGFARAGRLLSPEQCRKLRALYAEERRFRSRVIMSRYRFGRGEYQYFANPLPKVVQELREAVYRQLAPIAGRWMTAIGQATEYPGELEDFTEICRQAGQTRPTPLLLRYGAGDFNCLHQDVYGSVVFPFQLIVALSEVGTEYTGGELLLVEQQPRAQSKGQVVPLAHGEGVVITTRHRPVQGARGTYKVNVRHGVSPIRDGERYTLGVIFHDAE